MPNMIENTKRFFCWYEYTLPRFKLMLFSLFRGNIMLMCVSKVVSFVSKRLTSTQPETVPTSPTGFGHCSEACELTIVSTSGIIEYSTSWHPVKPKIQHLARGRCKKAPKSWNVARLPIFSWHHHSSHEFFKTLLKNSSLSKWGNCPLQT